MFTCRLWLVWGVFLSLFIGGDKLSAEGRAQREVRERVLGYAEAQELLKGGDKAYDGGDFDAAVAAYREAVKLLSTGSKTAEIRRFAVERFAQAATQRARGLAKGGRGEEAHKLLDEVLADGMAPWYEPARIMKEKADDALRMNPALTPEHVRNIDKARRKLYEAKGFYNLAQYDKALLKYEEVLRIDPYNKAARRGMEGLAAAVSDYAGAAQDETRARMLMAVDKNWEIEADNVKAASERAEFIGEMPGVYNGVGVSLEEKLRRIKIPQVTLEQVNIAEVIEYLEGRVRQLDDFSILESEKGVSFVLDVGQQGNKETDAILGRRFSLNLRGVPVEQVLEYATEQSQTRYRVDEYAVVVYSHSGGAGGGDMVARQFKVPPGFLNKAPIGEVNDDPFETESGSKGLVRRLTAKEFLERSGVDFPLGASANYNASANILMVKNTGENMELAQQIIGAVQGKEPVQVVLEVTFVRTKQTNLEELGFDWYTNDAMLGGDSNVYIGGGTQGSGRDIGVTGGGGVTAGNRSGQTAFSQNAIDAAIGGGQSRTVSELSAPGVVSVLGVFDRWQFATLMRGLKQKKGVDLMTKPSVVTKAGQRASVESVREMKYPTEYEPPEMPDDLASNTIFVNLDGNGNVIEAIQPGTFYATPSHPTAFETVMVGTKMEIEPIVSADKKYVDLSVEALIREFDGFIDYGVPIMGGSSSVGIANLSFISTGTTGKVTDNNILQPVFSVIRANTNVTIQSGATVVIGGLLKEKVEIVEDKVPILGDIPIIGRAFRSEGQQREKEALLIMVTARVVDPGGQPYQ